MDVMTNDRSRQNVLRVAARLVVAIGLASCAAAAGPAQAHSADAPGVRKERTVTSQHSGTMTRGEPQLTITVVPDSGTGELAGLAGTMMIKIADGKHSYEMDYTLAAKP